ncbi:hypothetical protein FHS77_002691 [Paenochrobactrum gallinarii]|uniref:Uncharacterized protein n=1 Tax=Paenochrobactrum gallinarii TaxID=643673 RepID=A0A841LVD6_9HYPH|nr:hypothetical protein [Paenochrobactrum gallinarii]MBB6262123.1 hypothetical protein [Paenochrobactrum gallinarii]
MTLSQILLSASQSNRRLAWDCYRGGKEAEFKKRMSFALRNIKRAKQEREAEHKWKSGAAA